jgi:hypothetical protein
VWELARNEPVKIESNGKTVGIVLSEQEYNRLAKANRKPRQLGIAKDWFPGVDWDEVLSRPLEGFEDYME